MRNLVIWIWVKTWKIMAWLFEQIPLVGGLIQAKPKSCWDAFKELLFLFSLSLLPIFFTCLTEVLMNVSADDPFSQVWATFKKNIKSGEVFIFVNSLLAPVGYVLYKNMRDRTRYPNAMFSIWALMPIVGLSALIFALQRTELIVNHKVLSVISSLIFWVALTMRYTSIVYDGLRVDFVMSQKREEDDLINKLRSP